MSSHIFQTLMIFEADVLSLFFLLPLSVQTSIPHILIKRGFHLTSTVMEREQRQHGTSPDARYHS